MAQAIPLHVNGQAVEIKVDDPEMPLLYALRDNLGLHGPRFGCGLGQCGACTVHLDGAAIRSCITPLQRMRNLTASRQRFPGRDNRVHHPAYYDLVRRRWPPHSERR